MLKYPNLDRYNRIYLRYNSDDLSIYIYRIHGFYYRKKGRNKTVLEKENNLRITITKGLVARMYEAHCSNTARP